MAEERKTLHTLSNLISERRSKDKKRKQEMPWEEKREHIIEWTTFYRRNPQIFCRDYLHIKLHFFQEVMLYLLFNNFVSYFITSRGLSKTYMTAVFVTCKALLYPNSEILVASLTLGQSAKIIKEKIDDELCGGFSPILQYLKEQEWIKFIYSKENTECTFKNGSFIRAVVMGESTRGSRSTVIVIDEARLLKKTDIDAILVPTLRPRVYPARLKEEYKECLEEAQEVYLSSARTKDNWLWTAFRKCVNQHYNNPRIPHGFFSGDIFTAIASGIKTENDYYKMRENMNDLDNEMENLNIFLGENASSLVLYEDFRKNQVLNKPFYPPNSYEVLERKVDYEFNDNEIRIMSIDLAVSGGRNNDNSVYCLGNINISQEDPNRAFKRKLEYIDAKNGMNSVTQVLVIKRLFYDYQCSYVVMDSKGIGNVIYDMLSDRTWDEERGKWYDGWTIVNDSLLKISSDAVLNDKAMRTIDPNAIPIIIPIAGTPQINSDIHYSARSALKDGKIELLIDDSDADALFSEDYEWLAMSSRGRAEKLMPFLQTRYMSNEAVALEAKNVGGLLKVVEKSNTTKDRYMAFGYFTYACDKIETKYTKGSKKKETNWDNFRLTF